MQKILPFVGWIGHGLSVLFVAFHQLNQFQNPFSLLQNQSKSFFKKVWSKKLEPSSSYVRTVYTNTNFFFNKTYGFSQKHSLHKKFKEPLVPPSAVTSCHTNQNSAAPIAWLNLGVTYSFRNKLDNSFNIFLLCL